MNETQTTQKASVWTRPGPGGTTQVAFIYPAADPDTGEPLPASEADLVFLGEDGKAEKHDLPPSYVGRDPATLLRSIDYEQVEPFAVGDPVAVTYPNAGWGTGIVREVVTAEGQKPYVVVREDGKVGYFSDGQLLPDWREILVHLNVRIPNGDPRDADDRSQGRQRGSRGRLGRRVLQGPSRRRRLRRGDRMIRGLFRLLSLVALARAAARGPGAVARTLAKRRAHRLVRKI